MILITHSVDMFINGKQVIIRPVKWSDDPTFNIKSSLSGEAQKPEHQAVIIINSQYIAFI